MRPVSFINIKEFREEGYLQEVNRLFFHPLGLALETIIYEDGTEQLGMIWDCRNDPEGIVFEEIDQEKVCRITRLFAERSKSRRATLGFDIQPAPQCE